MGLFKWWNWPQRVEELLREAIHERNTRPRDRIDKQPWLERLDRLIKEWTDETKEDFRRMRDGLIKCRDHLFNFLEDPLIPPDNNGSERGIRNVKVKMKNSGTFRSDWGADTFLEIRSIVETAKKHGKNTFDAIRCLFYTTDRISMGIAVGIAE